MTVNFFVDVVPTATGTPAFSATASVTRTDVGDHGFSVAMPTQYQDGNQHQLYAYALDLTDTSGASNTVLPGSPISFQITAGQNNSAPTPTPTSDIPTPANRVFRRQHLLFCSHADPDSGAYRPVRVADHQHRFAVSLSRRPAVFQ